MNWKYLGLIVAGGLAQSGCGGSGTATTVVTHHIYIADTHNNRIVQVDDITGTNWTTFGTSGQGVNQFGIPQGLTTDSSGRIYIADTANRRIVRINDITGAGWTTFGTMGTGIGQFEAPSAVALDAMNRIYVVDNDNSTERIVRINDMTGAGWTTFGTSGNGTNQFSDPTGIAIASNGQIYVSDFGTSRVDRFDDMSGTNWTTFTGSQSQSLDDCVSIALDGLGHMLISDYYAGLVQTGLMSSNGLTEYATPKIQGAVYGPGNTFAATIYYVDYDTSQLVQLSSIAGLNPVSFGSQGSGVDQFNSPGAVAYR